MTDIKPTPIITDLPSPAPSDPLEALSWLGDTVEEIAEGLRARGIKGSRREAFACPLHNYLGQWGWYAGIDPFLIKVYRDDTETTFYTPEHWRHFILKFDGGSFPDLIDNG